MASGVKASDAAKLLFNNMKVNKAKDDSDKRIRVATFVIQNNEVDVCKIYTQDMLGKDGIPDDAYLLVESLMQSDVCYYILYDCHLETKEGIKKEELVFAMWIPEEYPIKCKMLYASSKESIKSICKGIKHDLQLNERGSVVPREIFAEGLEKSTPGIVALEGIRLCGKGGPPQKKTTF